MGLTTGQKWGIGAGLAALLGLGAYATRSKWLPAVKKATTPRTSCQDRFLFVGDSLTEYSESYADQFKSICPGLQYRKIAKSGEKTDWMLTQLSAALQLQKPDVVVIWGGVNDIYARNSIVSAKKNLQAMYDLAKSVGVKKVVAVTVIPTRTYKNATPQALALTNEINTWIRGNTSVSAVIDANKILNNGTDGTRPEFLQQDSLHITKPGQKAVMEEGVRVLF